MSEAQTPDRLCLPHHLQVEGDYEKFVGRIQEQYGKSREIAEKEADDWLDSID